MFDSLEQIELVREDDDLSGCRNNLLKLRTVVPASVLAHDTGSKYLLKTVLARGAAILQRDRNRSLSYYRNIDNRDACVVRLGPARAWDELT